MVTGYDWHYTCLAGYVENQHRLTTTSWDHLRSDMRSMFGSTLYVTHSTRGHVGRARRSLRGDGVCTMWTDGASEDWG